MAIVRKHLEHVLLLLGDAGKLDREAMGEQRKWLNQAVFEKILIDLIGDEDPHLTQETLSVQMTGELAEPIAAAGHERAEEPRRGHPRSDRGQERDYRPKRVDEIPV